MDKSLADELVLLSGLFSGNLKVWKIAGTPNKNKQDVVRTAKTEVSNSVPYGLDLSNTG